MKKFLIMLMVVAMASFLFVGCLGVTPPVDDVDEDEEPALPVSTTPVISEIDGGDVDLYSAKTQYVNGGFFVEGFAPKYSKVQVYIDGVVVGTTTAYSVFEYFKVYVDEDDLGVDGEKVLYATAKQIGLDESDPSTEYTFTLDTVAPKIVSVTAEGELVTGVIGEGTITVTFSEALKADTVDEDTAADIDDWTAGLRDALGLQGFGFSEVDPQTVELISPKVVEIEVDFGEGAEGYPIRVAYEDYDEESPITDLAGNPAVEFIEYCFLEIED